MPKTERKTKFTDMIAQDLLSTKTLHR